MANGHGGRRIKAGRPRGSFGKKRLEALRIAAGQKPLKMEIEEGVSPIEILMLRMQELWEKGDEESKDKACTLARDAAPYRHHRLSAVDQNLTSNNQQVIEIVRFSDTAPVEQLETTRVPDTPLALPGTGRQASH